MKNKNSILINKWTAYISISLCSFLITFSVMMCLNNKQKTNQIENINDNIKKLYTIRTANNEKEITNTIIDLQYKDSLVLNQISNNTAIILTLIALISSFGGIITFNVFKNQINKFNKRLKKNDTYIKETKEKLIYSQLSLHALNYTTSKISLLASFSSTIHTDDTYKKLVITEFLTRTEMTFFTFSELINHINTSEKELDNIFFKLSPQEKKSFTNYNIENYVKDFSIILINIRIAFKSNTLKPFFESKEDRLKSTKLTLTKYITEFKKNTRISEHLIENTQEIIDSIDCLLTEIIKNKTE